MPSSVWRSRGPEATDSARRSPGRIASAHRASARVHSMPSSVSFPSSVAALVPRALADPMQLTRDLSAWVLVGPAPVEDADEWSFRTLSARTVRDASGAIEAILDDSYLVHPLRKKHTGPFAATILIGRSQTNDVCIAHSSVSKLHARVRIEQGCILFVSDASSSNGTFVGEERLGSEVEKSLTHAAQLRFGACAFQLFEPERFVALLTRFSAPPRGR